VYADLDLADPMPFAADVFRGLRVLAQPHPSDGQVRRRRARSLERTLA
jgi:hypothetical protein